MAFDWITFLDRHKVDYVPAGSDNVETRCIWCGEGDQAHHLSISLRGFGYKCWKQPLQHKGRGNAKLVQALLGCSWAEAFNITGEGSRGPSLAEGAFLTRAKALLGSGKKSATDNRELEYPPEFRPLVPEGSGRYFVEYMTSRGYSEDDLYRLQRPYKLQCCISGFFKYRVVFPIYMKKRLVTWTGRSVRKETEVRYQTLSANPDVAERYGLPQAVMSIEQTLWNYDKLLGGGEELYICEGPFDALRLDSVGRNFGIRATCVFKKQISEYQGSLLDNVCPRFRRAYLLFDTAEHADTMRTRSQLAHLKLQTRFLPSRYKDPGEMDYKAAARFLKVG